MGKELEIDFKAESFLACKENGTLRLKAALSRQFSSFSRRDSGKDKAKHKLAMRKFINESRNEAGECLIHVASSRNAFGCIQILLENGADILAADLESKWTPLHKAVYYGAFASIKALHAFSTESSPGKWEKCISALDFEGKTPIDLFHWRESKWTQWGARLLRKDFPKRSESIQEKGFFLSCGSASNFQLGYDTNGTFQNTPRVSKHLAEKNILHVSLSKYAGAAVDDNGSCFVWGVNRKGLLGLEDKNETTVIAPTLLSALQNYKISQIACGKYHMVAVTQDGLVFSWGHGHLGHVQASGCFIREKQISLIPKPVVGLEKFKIAKVSVDENRTFFISADGELLLLGLSLDRSIIHTTVHRIRRFCESPLLDIVSQNNHIIILTTKGKVYEYNSSSNRFKNVPFPCDQYAINMHTKVSRRIIFISSCTEYSLAVSNTGHIFSWSHDSREGRGYEPFRLKFLKRFRFVSVSCSSSLSCGITVDGDVISWRPLEGSSSRCRFGWGKNPTRVEGIRNASMVVVDDESILFIEQLRSLCNSKTDPGSSLMDMCSKVIIENANLKSCLKFYRLGVQLDSSILTERMGAYIIENIELVFYRLIKKFSYEELVLLSEKYQEMRCSKSVRAIGNCSASNLDISQHVTDDMYNSINECDDENVVYEVFDTMEASFEEKSDDESVFLDSRGEIPSLEGKTNSKKEPFRFEGNADNTISSSLPWRRKVSEQKSDDPTVSFSKILQEQAKSNFRVSSPPFGSPTKKSTSNDPGKSAIPNGLSLMDFITNGKSKKKKSKRGTLFAESPKKSPWSSHMNASKTSFSDIVKEQEMSPKKPGFSSYKSVIEGSGSAWRLPIPLVNSEPQSLRDIQWEEVKLGLRKDRTVENNHLNQKSFPRLSASTSLNSRARSNVSKPTNSGTLLPRKLF